MKGLTITEKETNAIVGHNYAKTWRFPCTRKFFVVKAGEYLLFDKIRFNARQQQMKWNVVERHYVTVPAPLKDVGKMMIINDTKKSIRIYEHTYPDMYSWNGKNYDKTAWVKSEIDGGICWTFKGHSQTQAMKSWEDLDTKVWHNKIQPVPFDKNGKPYSGRWNYSMQRSDNYTYKQNGIFTGMIEFKGNNDIRANDVLKVTVFPDDQYVEHLGESFVGYMRLKIAIPIMLTSAMEEGFVLSPVALTFVRGHGKCLVTVPK
jgi:hypothetical protein